MTHVHRDISSLLCVLVLESSSDGAAYLSHSNTSRAPCQACQAILMTRLVAFVQQLHTCLAEEGNLVYEYCGLAMTCALCLNVVDSPVIEACSIQDIEALHDARLPYKRCSHAVIIL